MEKSLKAFVQNRVSDTRELLPSGRWTDCTGRDNCADLPSRGLTPRNVAALEQWSRLAEEE